MKATVSGLRAWLIQRISAAYMLVMLVYILVHFLLHPSQSYPVWRAWVANPSVTIGIALFYIALAAHIWVGIRDVLMDYVKSTVARILGFALLGAFIAVTTIWIFFILINANK